HIVQFIVFGSVQCTYILNENTGFVGLSVVQNQFVVGAHQPQVEIGVHEKVGDGCFNFQGTQNAIDVGDVLLGSNVEEHQFVLVFKPKPVLIVHIRPVVARVMGQLVALQFVVMHVLKTRAVVNVHQPFRDDHHAPVGQLANA